MLLENLAMTPHATLWYWAPQKANFETENVGREGHHSWRLKWCHTASEGSKMLQ